MPRKNRRRAEPFEPLDLTPAIVNADATRDRQGRRPSETFEQMHRREEHARRQQAERQRAARINKGIDWSVCLVPGCGYPLTIWGTPEHVDPFWRDHTVALPLCDRHLAVAGKQYGISPDAPAMVTALEQVLAKERAKATTAHAHEKRMWLANTYGEIYYVLLNGLVKVGWSRDLPARLRAYGPDVEVLCHYPASRADETNLHRQLRPFLAKGREWYRDTSAIRDFVARAVAQHGKPTIAAVWSQPAEQRRPTRRGA